MSYFDEEWYLQKYPDVRGAISRGEVASGRDHFRAHGRAEGRLSCDAKLLEKLAEADKLAARVFHFDQMLVTNSGVALILGWLDDKIDGVESLIFSPVLGLPVALRERMMRYYREDVAEKKARDDRHYDHGLWLFFKLSSGHLPYLGGSIKVELASDRTAQVEIVANLISPDEMRGRVLELLARPAKSQASIVDIAEKTGPLLRALNLEIASRAYLSPSVVHGERLASPALSIVISAQKAGGFLRQAALFANLRGVEKVEFIFVGNSPETASNVHALSQSASVLYGLQSVSVSTGANLGLAGALTRGARIAGAETVLFLGDGVFPGDSGALERVLDIAAAMEENDAIGGLLLTEDNSIQHDGRSFVIIDCVHGLWGLKSTQRGMHVGHLQFYARFEADATGMSSMLVRRAAFLRLGGFEEGYLTDEFQDADYCLRVRAAGGRTMIDSRMLFYSIVGRTQTPQPRDWASYAVDLVGFNESWRATLEGSALLEDALILASVQEGS